MKTECSGTGQPESIGAIDVQPSLRYLPQCQPGIGRKQRGATTGLVPFVGNRVPFARMPRWAESHY